MVGSIPLRSESDGDGCWSVQIDSKLAGYARQKKRVALVEKEIQELPAGTKTFQSIGVVGCVLWKQFE